MKLQSLCILSTFTERTVSVAENSVLLQQLELALLQTLNPPLNAHIAWQETTYKKKPLHQIPELAAIAPDAYKKGRKGYAIWKRFRYIHYMIKRAHNYQDTVRRNQYIITGHISTSMNENINN